MGNKRLTPSRKLLCYTARAVSLTQHTADSLSFITCHVQCGIGNIQRSQRGLKAPQRNAGAKPGIAFFVQQPARKVASQTRGGLKKG